MATTVIGAFDDSRTVRKVMDKLREAGCRGGDIEILEGSKDEIRAEIVERGFDEDAARTYAEAVGRGKTLVAARAPDARADDAMAVMERYEASAGEDEDGEDEEEGSGRRGARARAGGGGGREETVPEVEEELAVEKNKVARGGVRVTSSVTERPVQKTVSLREEKVEVEHRDLDRELSPEEAEEAFEEKTLEMTETSEEAEVEKTARVVGEVSLRKGVNERKETVRDTVRRTDVEVERLEPGARKKR